MRENKTRPHEAGSAEANVPEISVTDPADHSTLEAALIYAKAGFYVGPLKAGTKNPGSVLGDNWHQKTTRDPQVIVAMFAGTDHGVFLHVGRSDALVFDVDNPEQLPELLRRAFREVTPPYQSTRPDTPGRGRYVFRQPPGRDLGNSLGRLGNGWGEVRGRNGVIVVTPTCHPDGGRYQWIQTGAVPALPDYVAELLPDALEASEAATDGQVAAFLEKFSDPAEPDSRDLLGMRIRDFQRKVDGGEARHATMPGHLAGAMKEAAAGLLDAKLAADTLQAVFLDVVARPPNSAKQSAPRTGAVATNEWRGLLAWAVGQAAAADPAETRQRIEERFGAADPRAANGQAATNGWSPPDAYEFDDHEHQSGEDADSSPRRRIVLTSAANIKPKPVKWLWDGRLALRTFALCAGAEGLGKSTICYDRAALITKGLLPGEFYGTPKSVLVCATEDDWEMTVVPRLIAHGADLSKVFRVEVLYEDVHTGLVLPKDIKAVEEAAKEVDAVLLLLDPLMSRIDGRLDTHKDAEVRRALEPMAAMAHTIGLCVWGIIHHNKGGSSDPLQAVMASKAFTGVARSVHTVLKDPDDEHRRLFGMPKNNLGRDDLPTLAFTFDTCFIATDEGPAPVGRIHWEGESTTTIAEAMQRVADGGERNGATTEAMHWLEDFLTVEGGTAESMKIKASGREAGHNISALQRARTKLKLGVEERDMPRRTWWTLPLTRPQLPLPLPSSQKDTGADT